MYGKSVDEVSVFFSRVAYQGNSLSFLLILRAAQQAVFFCLGNQYFGTLNIIRNFTCAKKSRLSLVEQQI